MEKENVTKFDINSAFQALDEIEYPEVGGIKPKRLTETLERKFNTGEALLEDIYDLGSQEDLEQAQEDREKEIAQAKLAKIEKIVDLDADSADDLLDSYEGKVIIQCPQCKTMFYKNQEDIEASEEDPAVVNIAEICQHCGNDEGYEVVGKVAAVEPEEMENFETEEELPVEGDEEETVEDEEVEEEATEEAEEELPEAEEEPEEEKKEESLESSAGQILTEEVEDKEDCKICPECGKEVCECDKLEESVEGELEAFADKLDEEVLDEGEFGNWIKKTAGKIGDKAKNVVNSVGATLGSKDAAINNEYDDFIIYIQQKGKEWKDLSKPLETVPADRQPLNNNLYSNIKDAYEKLCNYIASGKDFVCGEIWAKNKEGKNIKIRAFSNNDFENGKFKKAVYDVVITTKAQEKEDKIDAKAKITVDSVQAALDKYAGNENLKVVPLNISKYDEYKELVRDTTSYAAAEKIAKAMSLYGAGATIVPSDKFEDSSAYHNAIAEFKDGEITQKGKERLANLMKGIFGLEDTKVKESLEEAKEDINYEISDAEWKELLNSFKNESLEEEICPVCGDEIDEPCEDCKKELEEEKVEEEQCTVHKAITHPEEDMKELKEEKEDSKEDDEEKLEDLPVEEVVEKIEEVAEEIKEVVEPAKEVEEAIDEIVEEKVEEILPIEEEEVDFEDIEELDEESINESISKYLKEVYDNVDKFEATKCEMKENKLVVEGMIKFNSGSSRSTLFEFKHNKTKENVIIFHGINESFSKKPAFILRALVEDKKLITEKLKYRYEINGTLVEGLIK